MPASLPRCDGAGREAAIEVGLFLAGLSGEKEASRRLGLGAAEFRCLLEEMSLKGGRVLPVAVGPDLAPSFLDMKNANFDAPTFDRTVEQARTETGHPLAFSLPAQAILEAPLEPRGARPTGIILHVGRCGSTLLCNLLASSGGWTALREPEFCNSLFLARASAQGASEIERIETLIERLLGSLEHGLRPGRCAIKFSSWTAALAADLLARRSDLRIAVVVRDPWATVASFLAQPPYWSGDRPAGAGIAMDDSRASEARFFARAWRSIVQTALQLPRERVLFLRYEDIGRDPLTIVGKLRRHFGDRSPISGRAAIARSLASYSKGRANEPFDPAGRHRRAALASDLRDVVTATTAREWRAASDILAT